MLESLGNYWVIEYLKNSGISSKKKEVYEPKMVIRASLGALEEE